jgi:tetratricopeptide (TPR) repeat protein
MTALQRVRQLHLAEHNEAVRLANAGSVDLALEHALASLAMDGHFVPGIILAGKLLWRRNRFLEAIGRWQQAVSIAPENKEAKDLIATGQAFLKRRCMRRTLAMSGLGVGAALIVCFLPAGAFLHVEGRTSDLASRIAVLEKASRRDGVPAVIPPPIESPLPSEEPSDSAILPSAGEATRVDLSEVTEKIRALSEQQQTISSSMQSNTVAVRNLAAIVADMQAELAEQESAATARLPWAQATVSGVVEALCPVKMQALQEKIAKMEGELTGARSREESLRARTDLVGALIHRNAKRKVSECEANLRLLREEWQKDVIPWIQAKERTDAAFPGTGQGQGQ